MSTDDIQRAPEHARFGPRPGKHRDDCAWTLHQHTCSCEYPRYVAAVEAVAADVVRAALGGAIDSEDIGWEDYPELPEFVWDDVCEKARALAGGSYESSEAYRALSALATTSGECPR